jgi:nucleotide-binding universal stress UspA family protein
MNTDVTNPRLSRNRPVPGPSRFRSVLVAIDLTPNSDRVLGRLPLLPLADDARIGFLHVVPGSLTPGERRRAERDAIREVAEEIRHCRHPLPRTLQIQTLVKVGATAKTISACASAMKAELVVMGRGGKTFLRDEFIGSTAERVIRQAKIPVLVVKLPPRARYSRPALAIATDKAAPRAVDVMLRMLPPPRPGVLVIHAFDSPYHSYIYPSLSEDDVQERMEELQLSAGGEIRTLLRKALSNAGVPKEDAPRWMEHFRFGSPRLLVERAVKKRGVDLLVLGTRGYSSASTLFLGTVAGDLLRRARCDVLVVPPAPRE